jgi:hypothetical protein
MIEHREFLFEEVEPIDRRRRGDGSNRERVGFRSVAGNIRKRICEARTSAEIARAIRELDERRILKVLQRLFFLVPVVVNAEPAGSCLESGS